MNFGLSGVIVEIPLCENLDSNLDPSKNRARDSFW